MIREVYLAGGCYWGTQKFLDNIQGVVHTEVGFANGNTPSPTYDQVKHSDTGYTETVHVQYDNAVISLKMLLELFFNIIDPTSLNRQGGDIGTNYRTGIYTVSEEDRAIARECLSTLQNRYMRPIVVECEPLRCFYTAHEAHQKYLDKNPGGYCHVSLGMIQKAKNWKPGEPTQL